MSILSELKLQHQARVRDFLKSRQKPTWKILETCRLENQGILTLPQASESHCGFHQIASFIPAAGAASRFTAPFMDLLLAYQNGPSTFTKIVQKFQHKYANVPLPDQLVRFLDKASKQEISPAELEPIYKIMSQPKALFPCGHERETFLQYKIEEHRAIGTFAAQAYIAPAGHAAEFLEQLKDAASPDPIVVMEQSDEMCTYRFDKDANIFLDVAGQPALVSGGHGMLSRLFPAIKEQFPSANSLFIRNIDNLADRSEARLEETRNFLRVYENLIRQFQQIRTALNSSDIPAADQEAQNILESLGLGSGSPNGKLGSNLVTLQKRFLHTPDDILPEQSSDWNKTFEDKLREAYQRPLSMVGQVANSGHDRGGIPVWAELNNRKRKLCLEGPHISAADMHLWFDARKLVTHFNPVFLVTEIPPTRDYYLNAANDLWVIAEKSYQGQPAYYCESVLYEMIANSALANCLFFEISRDLFRPRKSLDDLLSAD